MQPRPMRIRYHQTPDGSVPHFMWKYSVSVVVVVVLKSDEGERSPKSDPPHDDGGSRRRGEKTYRVPEGRPQWAQPVDLMLPIINTAHGQTAKRRAIHDFGSAARADDRPTNSSSTLESHSAIQRSEAAVKFGVPRSDPPIPDSQTAASTVQSIVSVDYGTTANRSKRPVPEINLERLAGGSTTVWYTHTYSTSTTDIPPDRKPSTRKDSRPTKSGLGRPSSCDPRPRMDQNAVGSTRRVSLRDCADNRKWPTDKTAPEKSRILDKVNRKFCGTGGSSGRNLMTSSVTAVVSLRSCSAVNVRSSASLGAQQITTSSKPKPQTQRHLAATQCRVYSFAVKLSRYPHMPIGKVWIYRSLFVCVFVCVFVRLRISPPRVKLAASNFAWRFIGVQGKESPIVGNFASTEAQNWTNRPARGPRTPLQYITRIGIGMCG